MKTNNSLDFRNLTNKEVARYVLKRRGWASLLLCISMTCAMLLVASIAPNSEIQIFGYTFSLIVLSLLSSAFLSILALVLFPINEYFSLKNNLTTCFGCMKIREIDHIEAKKEKYANICQTCFHDCTT